MARLNLLTTLGLSRTHEGARAPQLSPVLELRRSVLACLLWEREFYEEGAEIAARIASFVPLVEAGNVAALAVEAREQMKLRHVPLLLVREMARHKTGAKFFREMRIVKALILAARQGQNQLLLGK